MEKQIRILFIPLFLFIGCFLAAGFLNRYASDDFEFLSRYRDLGFAESVVYFYNNWNTRWLAISFMNVVFAVTELTGSLLWYHVLSLFLLWFAFFRICSRFLFIPKLQLVLISGFSVISFFYSCFSISDVFFWVNTSTMYLYGTIAFLFIIGELLNEKNKISGYLLLSFSAFYLGGAYEPLVFTVMLCGAGYLIYMFLKNGQTIISKPSVLKTIVLLSVLMIAFAISYAGEGHTIRSSFLPQTTISYKLLVWGKSMIKMLFIFLPLKLLVAIPLAFPWFIIGAWKPFPQLTNSFVWKALFVLFALTGISLAPLAMVMSEMGPERAWTQISVYITLFASLLAAFAGSKSGQLIKSGKTSIIVTVMISFFIITTGFFAVTKDRNYIQAYSERMELLGAHKINGDESMLTLKPLPDSGWLHSAEISEIHGHFTNQHLKKYLQLKCDIQKEKESE